MIHRESLLHFRDEIPETLTGFNPLRSAVYVARHSYLEKWLPHRTESVRTYNPPSNRLIHEVLFLVHDYLHVWAFNWLRRLVPALRVGEKPITRDTIEDFVFCHLVTEAAATVGGLARHQRLFTSGGVVRPLVRRLERVVAAAAQ